MQCLARMSAVILTLACRRVARPTLCATPMPTASGCSYNNQIRRPLAHMSLLSKMVRIILSPMTMKFQNEHLRFWLSSPAYKRYQMKVEGCRLPYQSGQNNARRNSGHADDRLKLRPSPASSFGKWLTLSLKGDVERRCRGIRLWYRRGGKPPFGAPAPV